MLAEDFPFESLNGIARKMCLLFIESFCFIHGHKSVQSDPPILNIEGLTMYSFKFLLSLFGNVSFAICFLDVFCQMFDNVLLKTFFSICKM
jgi:hypothetical protein